MKVVSGPPRPTLENFASWFHQDFGIQFPSVELGGQALIQQLSSAERHLLTSDLAAFLTKHETSSDNALRNAWLRLGAQYWPRRAPTKSILTEFLRQLRASAIT